MVFLRKCIATIGETLKVLKKNQSKVGKIRSQSDNNEVLCNEYDGIVLKINSTNKKIPKEIFDFKVCSRTCKSIIFSSSV